MEKGVKSQAILKLFDYFISHMKAEFDRSQSSELKNLSYFGHQGMLQYYIILD